MIDFEILPTALLFIAGAIPNTLFMAFVIIIASIVFGSLIAVLRLRGGRLLNGIFTVLISFSAPCRASCSSSSCTILCPSFSLRSFLRFLAIP